MTQIRIEKSKTDDTPFSEILYVPIEQVVESPSNPRTTFDKDTLQELAASITRHGILEPLLVRSFQTSGNGHPAYQIVAGARRFRAAKLAGQKEVPCIVKVLTDTEVVLLQQIENLHRDDLSPLDEARGYAQLRKLGLGVKDIAGEVGKSPSHVYSLLAIPRCVPAVLKAVEAGKISTSHAALIATVTKDQQEFLLNDVLDFHYSVAELRENIEMRQHKSLTSAPWELKDGTLPPNACDICPKNTNVSEALRSTVGKKHTCTDADCFAHKLQAFIAREIKQADAKGIKLQRLSQSYSAPSGALPRQKWNASKLKDKGAEKGIMVDGDDAGKVVTFVRVRETSYRGTDANWQAREKKRKARAAVEKRYREAVFAELQKKAPKKLGKPELEMIEREVNPSRRIKGTIEQRILLGIVETDVRVTEYWTPKGKDLFALAKRSKVDLRKIRRDLAAKDKAKAKGGKK